MKLPLRRFSIADLEVMRRAGILAPRPRIELLEGILVDIPRPSAKKLEVIQRLTDVLVKQLGDATVVMGEPIHPEAYAVFDPAIMVHEWDKLPFSASYPLHRFSVDDYRKLNEVGILRPASRYELIDGVVLEAPLRRPLVQGAIDRVVHRLRHVESDPVVRLDEAVRLGPYSLARPDVTVCHPRPDRYTSGPPSGEDVIFTVDVVPDTGDVVRIVSWPVYARWGISCAWLFDVRAPAIHVGREPSNRGFGRVESHAAGRNVTLPFPLDDVAIEADEVLR